MNKNSIKEWKNISAYYPKTNTIYNKDNKENKNYIENFSTENDDYIWGVNEKDEIFKKKYNDSSWTKVNGQLKNISASGKGYIWGLIKIIKFMCVKIPCNGDWKLIDGNLKTSKWR